MITIWFEFVQVTSNTCGDASIATFFYLNLIFCQCYMVAFHSTIHDDDMNLLANKWSLTIIIEQLNSVFSFAPRSLSRLLLTTRFQPS